MASNAEQRAVFNTGDPLGQWDCTPVEWNELTLWDLADYINGRAFRPTDFSETGLKVIKITELKYGLSRATAHYDGPFEQKHLLRDGDLLFAWSGNPETSLDCYCWRGGSALLNQHIFRVLPRDTISKEYLYYVLRFMRPTFIRTARDKATSMGHVKVTDLKRLIVRIPPPAEQRAIAEVLAALDDMIELNRRMNETLEAMARAIFKSWFIDFDPVRAKAEGGDPGLPKHIADLFPERFEDSEVGKIPAGWVVRKLSDLCSTQYGYTASAVDEPVGPKFLRVTDINKRNWIEWGDVPHCAIDPEARASYALQVGDLVVARMADPGKSAIIEEKVDAVFASYLVRLKTTSLAGSYYVYGFLKSDLYADYSEGAKSGSVQPNMNANVIVGATLVVPLKGVIEQFFQAVLPLRQRLVANVRESRALAALRDTLLPKLISGELRVKTAEKFISEVA